MMCFLKLESHTEKFLLISREYLLKYSSSIHPNLELETWNMEMHTFLLINQLIATLIKSLLEIV